jgi:sterol-4alpha-carboxylate 3-dehydrogenase (decarboxylating)
VLAAKDEKLSTCALRPSVIFGPGDYQLIPSLHTCIAKGETPFVIGSGENLWDVTYVSNIADAHVLAVENLLSEKTAAGEAFFI